jgi:hypothetical protein
MKIFCDGVEITAMNVAVLLPVAFYTARLHTR